MFVNDVLRENIGVFGELARLQAVAWEQELFRQKSIKEAREPQLQLRVISPLGIV